MSDGMYFQPCKGCSRAKCVAFVFHAIWTILSGMLATQMNEKVSSNELEKFSIVHVDKWTCSTIHERKWVFFGREGITHTHTIQPALSRPLALISAPVPPPCLPASPLNAPIYMWSSAKCVLRSLQPSSSAPSHISSYASLPTVTLCSPYPIHTVT